SSLHFSPLPNSCALTNGRSPETPLFPYTTLFRSIEHFGLAHESGEESDGTVRKRFLDEERVREFGRRLAERGFPARLVDDRDPERGIGVVSDHDLRWRRRRRDPLRRRAGREEGKDWHCQREPAQRHGRLLSAVARWAVHDWRRVRTGVPPGPHRSH